MKNYCNIDDSNREHIKELIRWLFAEVVSAGGDGDALWYSKYYDIKDILPLVVKINDEFKFKWQIDEHDDYIGIHREQEGITITNNVKRWDESPSWQQVMIKY
jgi:hypothetical protein